MNKDMAQKSENEKQEQTKKLLTVTHAHSLPGHTGFITIATLPPIYARKTDLNLESKD